MLDKRSNLQIAHGAARSDYRIPARPRPGFGLGSIRSRKRLLFIGALACLMIASIYVGVRSTTYTASSQLLIYIRQILTGADLAVLPGRADLPMVQNQIELLRSGNVLMKVIEALQLTKDPEFDASLHDPPAPQNAEPAHPNPEVGEGNSRYRAPLDAMNRKLSIRQVGTSHLVAVNFTSSDPEKAARIVNTLIRIYLQEGMRGADAALSKATTLRELYQSLGPSAQVISEAEPPIRADGLPAILILLIAAVLGLATAAAAAILLDMVDDSIRSAQQMEYVLGLECIGVVRRFPDDGAGTDDVGAQRLLAREGAVLRHAAAMLEDASSREMRTIGVTSILPGEGATTLAIGLARTLAASGKRVLLIDGVFANPSVSRWAADSPRLRPPIGSGSAPGALAGIVMVRLGLHVLPLANQVRSGNGLLDHALLDEVLRAAVRMYDLVIVDMPSVVSGPEVRSAAQSLDGFLLVVKWGVTKSELVRQAFHSVGQAQPKFIGTLLNMADEATMKRYGYELSAELKGVTAT